MNARTRIALVGIANGHELLIRYSNTHPTPVMFDPEIVEQVDKMPTVLAASTLEKYDPTVRFVDYQPCNGVHQLTFGSDYTMVRVVPMFARRSAYTVTLSNEDAYRFVRDMIGSNMFHVTATPFIPETTQE